MTEREQGGSKLSPAGLEHAAMAGLGIALSFVY